MTDDIRRLLDEVPFRPFTIHITDGRSFQIPTVDHAHVLPGGGRVWVYSDTVLYHIFAARHISGLTTTDDSASLGESKAA